MSQACATANPPKAFQHSSFHHTYAGSFLMDVWLSEVSAPSALRSTLPLHLVCKRATSTYLFAVHCWIDASSSFTYKKHAKRHLRAGLEAFICSAAKPQAVINSRL
ncbi:hypothetical protein QQF64_001890 [Cirrhinus molitorella]|uniref:Uncharacterized protein n=1 Tax=Cirrhinus molitorella TaxID=172907 RepID=A0ABR3MNR3_9TELE